MKRLKLILVLFLLSNIGLAQKVLRFDSISVVNADSSILKLNCKSTFVYYKEGFVLVSDDARVYSFLSPATEFLDLQLINYRDTGKTLSDPNSKSPVVIYENIFKNSQIAQYVRDNGILLLKRNNTAIFFY